MTTFYYHHTNFLAHDTGPGHIECPDRLRTIDAALSAPEFDQLIRKQPDFSPATETKIALVHSQKMIRQVLDKLPNDGYCYFDADTIACPSSGRAAFLAVEAVCNAVDSVFSTPNANAFCALRPPGHHAEPDKPMGFCLFNNIAIAAEYARTHYHLDRIAIVDFDVHHGNGTQTAFYLKKEVLYISSHEMPHYPGTGHPTETGVGNIINIPLHPKTSSSKFRDQYTNLVFPALIQFNPQLLLISAGFDAHQDDPLASIELTEADYEWVTLKLKEIAESCCEGRLVSALEGGYNLTALANSVSAHVRALLGNTDEAYKQTKWS